MALSPENASTARSRFTSGKSRTYSAAEVNTLMDAARAQGRASLEERCAALKADLALLREAYNGDMEFWSKLILMAKERAVAAERALLATTGKPENAEAEECPGCGKMFVGLKPWDDCSTCQAENDLQDLMDRDRG